MYNKASSYIYNKGDNNNNGVANNWSDVLSLELIIKRCTWAKKDKFNLINLDNKWEINNILGERMTKLGRKYKVVWKPTWVYKSGLLNSKDAFKFY